MEVLLVKDVDRLGHKGETKRVTEGYARNFLFARKMAVPLTAGSQAHHDLVKGSWERQVAKEKAHNEDLAKRIEGLNIKITKRAGEKGRLFGSVTNTEVAEVIQKETKIEIDKRHLIVDHIKETGEHEVVVRFGRDAKAHLKITVVPEEIEPKK